MREIKFRCWDGKKMIDDFFVQSNGDGVVFRKSIQAGTKIELMQYTDLKDKNNKEIFEGDIVKCDDKYYPIQIVKYTADMINAHDGDWDEWYCGFDLAVPGDECNVLHTQLTDEVEIIGNIYENPELLK